MTTDKILAAIILLFLMCLIVAIGILMGSENNRSNTVFKRLDRQEVTNKDTLIISRIQNGKTIKVYDGMVHCDSLFTIDDFTALDWKAAKKEK